MKWESVKEKPSPPPAPPAPRDIRGKNIQEITAMHRIITDKCRKNKGDINLIFPLSQELQTKLFDAMSGYPGGQGTEIHIKVVIKRCE